MLTLTGGEKGRKIPVLSDKVMCATTGEFVERKFFTWYKCINGELGRRGCVTENERTIYSSPSPITHKILLHTTGMLGNIREEIQCLSY